jgi:hypothetical protein
MDNDTPHVASHQSVERKVSNRDLEQVFEKTISLKNFETLVAGGAGAEPSTWPALIYNSLKPTMFFILHLPPDGARKLYVVTKEQWCGLHALYAGPKPLVYYRKANLLRTVVFEPQIETQSEGVLHFVTRKNWYKLVIVTLLMVRIVWTLVPGLSDDIKKLFPGKSPSSLTASPTPTVQDKAAQPQK